MKILSNPLKISNYSQVLRYLAPRVFRVWEKQNILGARTQRDLFEYAIFNQWKKTFQKSFWRPNFADFGIFRTADVHLPNLAQGAESVGSVV